MNEMKERRKTKTQKRKRRQAARFLLTMSIMLLPQEGVALGMCVSAQALGADGELIRNIILFSVLIYELVGPLATKESLKAAGAITEKPKEVLERRERKLAEAEPKELLERRKERAGKK